MKPIQKYNAIGVLALEEGQLQGGAGVSVLYDDFVKSLESRGIKVLQGLEHYDFGHWHPQKNLPKADLVVGFDQGISPKVYHASFKGKIYVISPSFPFYFLEDGPTKFAHAREKSELLGNYIIGLYGSKQNINDFNKKWNPSIPLNKNLFDGVVGLNINDYNENIVKEIAKNPKKRGKPKVSILFGSESTGKPEKYVQPVLSAIMFYLQKTKDDGANFHIYLGDFEFNEYGSIRTLAKDLKDMGVGVVNEKINKPQYLESALSSDIIISKPGLLTISEIIKYCQLSLDSPILIPIQSSGIFTEYFTEKILQSAGFEVIDHKKIEEELPDKLNSALTSLKEKKIETKEKAKKLRITNLVDLVLGN